jgi:hypothetical protein
MRQHTAIDLDVATAVTSRGYGSVRRTELPLAPRRGRQAFNHVLDLGSEPPLSRSTVSGQQSWLVWKVVSGLTSWSSSRSLCLETLIFCHGASPFDFGGLRRRAFTL